MSKRLEVAQRIKALVALACPLADVVGLTPEDARPARVGSNGRALIEQGDPGPPEIDLSPLAYNYAHAIPVQIEAASADTLDAMLVAIGGTIEADRTLGGLVDWLEAEMPLVEGFTTTGAAAVAGTTLNIVVSYATQNPLT